MEEEKDDGKVGPVHANKIVRQFSEGASMNASYFLQGHSDCCVPGNIPLGAEAKHTTIPGLRRFHILH